MLFYKILSFFFSNIFALVWAHNDQGSGLITYHVVSLLEKSQMMAVEVDGAMSMLMLNSSNTILYSGSAPIACEGYRYVKITETHNNIPEPFLRPPTYTDTVNEFFNRTWNKKEITQFPTVYEPLPAIHRIQSGLHKEGEIPTVHIVANQADLDLMHHRSNDDIDINANMTYVSLVDQLFFENVTLSISGHGSRWMPKVSYNVKLRHTDRLYGYKRIKLRPMANDPSYIREKLAYDMIKSVGLLSSEYSYVRVFMNDKEIGLFGLIEAFQNPWAANVFAFGQKDYKNGNLYQGFGHSPTMLYSNLSYMSNLSAYGDGQYVIRAGVKGDYKSLQKLTEFIANAPVHSHDAVTIWKSKLDVDSFLRSMALEVLNAYYDGYLNDNHNYYLYDNPETGAFFYIPADLDSTFGFSVSDLHPMITGDYSTFPGMYTQPLMAKILEVPEFKVQFEETIDQIHRCLVNPHVTFKRIDDLVDMLKEDVAWDQMVPRMGTIIPSMLDMYNISYTNGRVPPDIDIRPLINMTLSQRDNVLIRPFVRMIPKDPGDYERALDYVELVLKGVPFLQAVNGPTGYKVCIGVKEFIRKISRNIDKYNI